LLHSFFDVIYLMSLVCHMSFSGSAFAALRLELRESVKGARVYFGCCCHKHRAQYTASSVRIDQSCTESAVQFSLVNHESAMYDVV